MGQLDICKNYPKIQDSKFFITPYIIQYIGSMCSAGQSGVTMGPRPLSCVIAALGCNVAEPGDRWGSFVLVMRESRRACE